MKILCTIIAGLIINMAVQAETLRLSEPVLQDANSETFGRVINNELAQLSMADLVNKPAIHLGKSFKLQARIAKVCQKKGCFFIAQQEQHVMRVSFRDYGFFIPTDSHGKTVILEGELIQKVITPEQSTHFNADLNSDTAMLKPGEVYEIVADSVVIPI